MKRMVGLFGRGVCLMALLATASWLGLGQVRADPSEGPRRLGSPETPPFLPAAHVQQSEVVGLSGAYGAWSKIVFQSYRDGNWEIYSADGDGANQTRLTADPGIDTMPRLNRGRRASSLPPSAAIRTRSTS